MGLLTVLYFKVSDINGNLMNWENFRMNNADTSYFSSEIKIYDKNLYRYIEEFITLLERLLNFRELKNGLDNYYMVPKNLNFYK